MCVCLAHSPTQALSLVCIYTMQSCQIKKQTKKQHLQPMLCALMSLFAASARSLWLSDLL